MTGRRLYIKSDRCAATDVQSSNSQLSFKSKAMSTFIEESIIPLFTQAIMYGLYVGTSVHCLRWLLFDDTDWNVRKKINWPMLTIAILLFILMTINLWAMLQLMVGPALHVNVLDFEQTWWAPVDVRVFRDRTCSLRLD